MPGLSRKHLTDLRGATRMVVDAAEGIAGIVEQVHRTVQRRPAPLGRAVEDRPRGITGLVYRSVRGGIRLVGHGLDAGLGSVAEALPEPESSPSRDAWRAALNGVCGDYLFRTGNPLAIDMSLRYCGQPAGIGAPVSGLSRGLAPKRSSKLLLLVHGLCMDEQQWDREGYDHGAALADELGHVPLYLRYNSGLDIASNGRALATMLEALVGNWTPRVKEIAIIGYSMGGLVARSACHHALEKKHTWPRQLRKLVFLGTPHHGAPLEHGGYWLDFMMALSPYSAPFTRIARVRSAGITDLRHGTITPGAHRPVPLPRGVECYAVAAARTQERGAVSERLVGDGLVPVSSALGWHRDAARALPIPEDRQLILYRTGHLELLNHPELSHQLRRWLAGAG